MNLYYRLAAQISPALCLLGIGVALWGLGATRRKAYALLLAYFVLSAITSLVMVRPRLIEKPHASPEVQAQIDARAEEMSQVMKKYKEIPMTTGFSTFGHVQYFARTTMPFVLIVALFLIAHEDANKATKKTEQDAWRATNQPRGRG